MESSTMEEIKISEVLSSTFAVSTDGGEKVFVLINGGFQKDWHVVVDFQNIDLIVSTFLNAAIGQLYGVYTTEFIQSHLAIKNMTNEDLDVLKKVTDRAKIYFSDMKGFDKVFKKHFPDAS
jgi:hypothetical protein